MSEEKQVLMQLHEVTSQLAKPQGVGGCLGHMLSCLFAVRVCVSKAASVSCWVWGECAYTAGVGPKQTV